MEFVPQPPRRERRRSSHKQRHNSVTFYLDDGGSHQLPEIDVSKPPEADGEAATTLQLREAPEDAPSRPVSRQHSSVLRTTFSHRKMKSMTEMLCTADLDSLLAGQSIEHDVRQVLLNEAMLATRLIRAFYVACSHGRNVEKAVVPRFEWDCFLDEAGLGPPTLSDTFLDFLWSTLCTDIMQFGGFVTALIHIGVRRLSVPSVRRSGFKNSTGHFGGKVILEQLWEMHLKQVVFRYSTSLGMRLLDPYLDDEYPLRTRVIINTILRHNWPMIETVYTLFSEDLDETASPGVPPQKGGCMKYTEWCFFVEGTKIVDDLVSRDEADRCFEVAVGDKDELPPEGFAEALVMLGIVAFSKPANTRRRILTQQAKVVAFLTHIHEAMQQLFPPHDYTFPFDNTVAQYQRERQAKKDQPPIRPILTRVIPQLVSVEGGDTVELRGIHLKSRRKPAGVEGGVWDGRVPEVGRRATSLGREILGSIRVVRQLTGAKREEQGAELVSVRVGTVECRPFEKDSQYAIRIPPLPERDLLMLTVDVCQHNNEGPYTIRMGWKAHAEVALNDTPCGVDIIYVDNYPPRHIPSDLQLSLEEVFSEFSQGGVMDPDGWNRFRAAMRVSRPLRPTRGMPEDLFEACGEGGVLTFSGWLTMVLWCSFGQRCVNDPITSLHKMLQWRGVKRNAPPEDRGTSSVLPRCPSHPDQPLRRHPSPLDTECGVCKGSPSTTPFVLRCPGTGCTYHVCEMCFLGGMMPRFRAAQLSLNAAIRISSLADAPPGDSAGRIVVRYHEAFSSFVILNLPFSATHGDVLELLQCAPSSTRPKPSRVRVMHPEVSRAGSSDHRVLVATVSFPNTQAGQQQARDCFFYLRNVYVGLGPSRRRLKVFPCTAVQLAHGELSATAFDESVDLPSSPQKPQSEASLTEDLDDASGVHDLLRPISPPYPTSPTSFRSSNSPNLKHNWATWMPPVSPLGGNGKTR